MMLCWNIKVVLLVVLASMSFAGGKNEGRSRKTRFITFNTDDDELTVELDFTIPFIKIPVKKAMESTFGSSGLTFPYLNVNLAAVVIAGVVILGTVVVVPLLMKAGASLYPQHQYARLIDSTEFGADSVLDYANNLMMDHSLQGCALRVACWSATRPGDQADQLWSQVTRNHIIYSLINSTAMEEAISSGRQGRDCISYGPCSLREDQIPILLNSISALGK